MFMISFNNVCKIYSRNKVLFNTDLLIDKGEFIFLTGLPGSGKTTFFKLLSALEKPNKGSILVNNQNIVNFHKDEISDYRKKFGIILQNNYLLEGETALGNVILPLKINDNGDAEVKAKAVLDLVGLNNHANKIVNYLSESEKQRVSIARALINGPEIIIADDPTKNLDQELSRKTMEILIKLSKYGTTVFVATHELNLVKELNQRVFNIKNEKIVPA
jgi:cell division transport system ATP-binding protein